MSIVEQLRGHTVESFCKTYCDEGVQLDDGVTLVATRSRLGAAFHAGIQVQVTDSAVSSEDPVRIAHDAQSRAGLVGDDVVFGAHYDTAEDTLVLYCWIEIDRHTPMLDLYNPETDAGVLADARRALVACLQHRGQGHQHA